MACMHEKRVIDLDRAKFHRLCFTCGHKLVECSACDDVIATGPHLKDSAWRKWGWFDGETGYRITGYWCPECAPMFEPWIARLGDRWHPSREQVIKASRAPGGAIRTESADMIEFAQRQRLDR